MKKYMVRFNAGTERGLIIYVEANTVSEARRVAMAELSGKAGYMNKKIVITHVQTA